MGVIDLDARVKKLEAEQGGGAVIDQIEADLTALEEQINGDGETDLGLAGDVADLQTAVGDLQDGHIYSTTEHVVGKWIDGSDVYEKSVKLEDVAYTTANTNYTVMEVSDIALPISLTAMFSNSGKTIYHSSPYVATDTAAKKSYFDFDMENSLIYFVSQDTWASTNMIVTARYTKTASNEA